jgi:hypothetical protein
MAKTRMPRDDNSQSIPVLRFREGGAQRINTLTSSSLQRIEVSEGVKVITVVATNPIFFGTGRSDVVATSSSHYLEHLVLVGTGDQKRTIKSCHAVNA